MCGIAGIASVNKPICPATVERMTRVLAHRGPDDQGTFIGPHIGLGNRRLAILDLSSAGHQPMRTDGGRYVISYNGEVYNYLELRSEIGGHFRTSTDTEVVLRAFERWGTDSLRRMNGMFAFAMWDNVTETLVLARDRFGVKPLYYSLWNGALYFGSEVKALAAAGVPIEPDQWTWRQYLAHGAYDHTERTFYKNVRRVPPGHYLLWRNGEIRIVTWYDLADITANSPDDSLSDQEALHQLRELFIDSVRLRFRSDVPVGVCLSGGVDSSTLVGTLHQLFRADSEVHVFHFNTGDTNYDETPWVERLLEGRNYPLHICRLDADAVPAAAEQAALFQEEPFGGIPTLAMTRLFGIARRSGTIVLLDGQGLDEQWGGYDYYHRALESSAKHQTDHVQGSTSSGTRVECLAPDFLASDDVARFPDGFSDRLKHFRYLDLRFTKIPRALRFSDRASSQASCELREPCLDYRLVEFAFRQPRERLIRNGENKVLLRQLSRSLLPGEIACAPKRAVQTPQREWLRGPLKEWVEACLSQPSLVSSGWFNTGALRREWESYVAGQSDNSFYVWQWISVALNENVIKYLNGLGRSVE